MDDKVRKDLELLDIKAEEAKIINDFNENLINNQKLIDDDIAEIISKDLFHLL